MLSNTDNYTNDNDVSHETHDLVTCDNIPSHSFSPILISHIADLEKRTREQAEQLSLNGKERLFSGCVLAELQKWYARSEEALRIINGGNTGEMLMSVMGRDQYESISRAVNDALTPVVNFVSHLTETEATLGTLQREKIQWLQEKEALSNDALERDVQEAVRTEYLRQDLLASNKKIKSFEEALASSKEEIGEKMEMIGSLTHKLGEYDNLVASLKGELEWEKQLRKNSESTVSSLIKNNDDVLALHTLACDERVETLKALANAMETSLSVAHAKIATLESEVKEKGKKEIAAAPRAAVDIPCEGIQLLTSYPYLLGGPTSDAIDDHTAITSLNRMEALPTFQQASVFWIEGHLELETLRARVKQLRAEKDNHGTSDGRHTNVIKKDCVRRVEQGVSLISNATKGTFHEKSQLVESLAAALEEVEHVRIANNKLKDELAGLQWTNEFLLAELIRGSTNTRNLCLVPHIKGKRHPIVHPSHTHYDVSHSDSISMCFDGSFHEKDQDVNSDNNNHIEKREMIKILKRDINQIAEAAKSARKGIEDTVDPEELKAATEAHHKLKNEIVKLHKEQGLLTKLCDYKKRQLAAATRESIIMSTSQKKTALEGSTNVVDNSTSTKTVYQKPPISYSYVLEIIDDLVSISMEISNGVSEESVGATPDLIIFLNALGSMLSSADEDLANKLKVLIDDKTLSESKTAFLKILKENIALQLRLHEIEATAEEYQRGLEIFEEVGGMLLSEDVSQHHERLILSDTKKGTEKRTEILHNLAISSVENKRLTREVEEAFVTINDLKNRRVPELEHEVIVLRDKLAEIEASKAYMMDICLKLAAVTSRTLMGAKEKQTRMNHMEREIKVVRDSIWASSEVDTCDDSERLTGQKSCQTKETKNIKKQSNSTVQWLRNMLGGLIKRRIIQVCAKPSSISVATSRLSGVKRIHRDDNEEARELEEHTTLVYPSLSSLEEIVHTFIESTNQYIKNVITTEHFNHLQGFKTLLQLVQTLQESNQHIIAEYKNRSKTLSIDVAESMAQALYNEAYVNKNYDATTHLQLNMYDDDDICDSECDDIVRISEEYSARGSSILLI